MDFSEKMQSYRKQRGLSQEKLAEIIGVSRQAVSKWESGQSYPEMDKLISLSELFRVSLDHLVKDVSDQREEVQHFVPSSANMHSRPKFHYEYKSKTSWFGVPLIHIHIGRGVHVAKGIIAIGNIAIGALSVGVVALGGLCFGVLGAGLISLAALALGLLLGAGGFAAGALAFGGLTIGIVAVGGLSIGMFALGGCAVASHIAIGGYASGHIAIGDMANGAYTILIPDGDFGSIQAGQVRELIGQEYPNLWKPLKDAIVSMFRR